MASIWRRCAIFQLTTSQGGRRTLGGANAEHRNISTHDLTRRSTKEGNNVMDGPVFQLTTSQGGRLRFQFRFQNLQDISTHDLTRRSTLPDSLILSPTFISTHDLTRRSTAVRKLLDLNLTIFQLTTSQGGRPAVASALATSNLFQLTTSQGGRLFSVSRHTMQKFYFNSRPHKEVDSSS